MNNTAHQKKRFQPGLWATVFAVPLFLALLGLGTWQVYRLQWKEELLAQIHERTSGEALPLPQTIDNPEDWNYRKAMVTGTFEHDKEIHLLANRGAGSIGYEVITPLKRSDGGGYVLVDRGWVPEQFREPETRPQGQVKGEQTVTGILRRSFEKPWLVPENRPEEGLWMYANIPQMEDYLGLDTFPMFLQADDTPNPGGLPQGGQTRIDIPNNHLQYAITWYGIAIALLVIFIVFHMRPVEEEDRP